MHMPHDLIHRFFWCLDQRDTEGVLATLSPDVVWLRQGRRHVGLEGVTAALSSRSPTLYVRHVVSNLFEMSPRDIAASDITLREVDADLQAVRPGDIVLSSYLSGYTHDDGTQVQAPCHGGHLHKMSWVRTRLSRHEDGWRIVAKHMLPLFVFGPA
ncbi:hypothetical protein [Pigmentiphaga litoralis]|uniref:hypothetical protein n=1 Tax=Pigmentiphaga litoralis TaxID=516702 RepID=UPI003B42A939